MGSIYGQWTPSADLKPSIFKPLCHPLYPKIAKETDEYFLKYWKFPDEKSRRKFLAADYSRFACLNYPLSLDDRIGFACRIITLLFLTDDEIDYMPLADAEAYNEKLILIARGLQKPDRTVPSEWMMWDLWEDMRAHDAELAYTVEAPCFLFMRAQVDKTRLDTGGLSGYFEFREKDIGTALVCAIMTFCMGLHMSDEEMRLARPIVSNFAKNLLCFNDIYSYEKELRVQDEGSEGGIVVSAVPMVADLAQVSVESAKRILWTMCREWEANHHRLVAKALRENNSPALKAFCKGIEYQYSGNELWSHETGRYK
ncbi:Aristolochene synthase [Biscogniauxia marginata]|nr:Aristolochene synthase [Biscogniauxia marginata]